jgi:hypothetical protein
MSINDKEFETLLAAIDRSLRHFEARPVESGFDQDVYDELRRVREGLLRARRDMHDPNLKRDDSPSPSGPTLL